MALVLLISILFILNVLAFGYIYYQKIYRPKKKSEFQIANGRIPDEFLPSDLQEEEQPSVKVSGRIYARKPEPQKWANRQEKINDYFYKHPEMKEAWLEKRRKHQLPHDAGMGDFI